MIKCPLCFKECLDTPELLEHLKVHSQTSQSFVWGILPGHGGYGGEKAVHANPIAGGEVQINPDSLTEIMNLEGDGLVIQISFTAPMTHFEDFCLCIEIDGRGFAINTAACLENCGQVGPEAKSLIYIPTKTIRWKKKMWYVMSCHLPFRFHKSFKWFIQNRETPGTIRDSHMYYLIPLKD